MHKALLTPVSIFPIGKWGKEVVIAYAAKEVTEL